jgi:hypothetical protein
MCGVSCIGIFNFGKLIKSFGDLCLGRQFMSSTIKKGEDRGYICCVHTYAYTVNMYPCTKYISIMNTCTLYMYMYVHIHPHPPTPTPTNAPTHTNTQTHNSRSLSLSLSLSHTHTHTHMKIRDSTKIFHTHKHTQNLKKLW